MSILPLQKWIPVTFWQLEEWTLLAFGLETSPEVFSVIYCFVAFKTDCLRIFFFSYGWLVSLKKPQPQSHQRSFYEL